MSYYYGPRGRGPALVTLVGWSILAVWAAVLMSCGFDAAVDVLSPREREAKKARVEAYVAWDDCVRKAQRAMLPVRLGPDLLMYPRDRQLEWKREQQEKMWICDRLNEHLTHLLDEDWNG